MVEPADAKDLIDEAIERAEEHHDAEQAQERIAARRFRDRVSIMVGVFAVSLAIVHMAAASDARDSLLKLPIPSIICKRRSFARPSTRQRRHPKQQTF
jgi:hypothetical protein